MSARELQALWIDAALGEIERSRSPRASLEPYERTAARIHVALALEAPLGVPLALRARLVAQGLRHQAARRAGNPSE